MNAKDRIAKLNALLDFSKAAHPEHFDIYMSEGSMLKSWRVQGQAEIGRSLAGMRTKGWLRLYKNLRHEFTERSGIPPTVRFPQEPYFSVTYNRRKDGGNFFAPISEAIGILVHSETGELFTDRHFQSGAITTFENQHDIKDPAQAQRVIEKMDRHIEDAFLYNGLAPK